MIVIDASLEFQERRALANYKRWPDPCEWNPKRGQPAYYDEVHGPAEVVLGEDGRWRLCKKCASLPRFRRFRKRWTVNGTRLR